MQAITEFLSMNGYATFIWPVYGVALVVCGAVWINRTRNLKALEADQQNEDQSL